MIWLYLYAAGFVIVSMSCFFAEAMEWGCGSSVSLARRIGLYFAASALWPLIVPLAIWFVSDLEH